MAFVEERWRVEVGGCDALAAGAEVVVIVTEADLMALDALTGDLWWSVAVESGDDVDLAVCAGVVHFATDGSERSIEVSSGQEIFPPTLWPEASAQGEAESDTPEVEFYAEDTGVVAIDTSGNERWWVELDEDYLVAVEPAGDVVLVNGSRGLHVIAAQTGESVAMVAADEAATAPSSQIVFSGGRAFAGLADGWLVCVDVSEPGLDDQPC